MNGKIEITYQNDTFVAAPDKIVLSGKTYVVDVSGLALLPAEIKIAESAPEVALPADIEAKPAEEKAAIQAAADVLQEDSSVKSEGLTAAASDVIGTDGVVVEDGVKTVTDAQTALTEAGITTDSQPITLVAEPYLGIEVKGAEISAETNKLVLNITPYYNLKATTADKPEKHEQRQYCCNC